MKDIRATIFEATGQYITEVVRQRDEAIVIAEKKRKNSLKNLHKK